MNIFGQKRTHSYVLQGGVTQVSVKAAKILFMLGDICPDCPNLQTNCSSRKFAAHQPKTRAEAHLCLSSSYHSLTHTYGTRETNRHIKYSTVFRLDQTRLVSASPGKEGLCSVLTYHQSFRHLTWKGRQDSWSQGKRSWSVKPTVIGQVWKSLSLILNLQINC